MSTKFLLKENSILAWIAAKKLKVSRVAMVLGQTIYLHNSTKEEFLNDSEWLRHEMVHLEQYKRYGVIKFLALYIWYSIKHGYYNNPLEVEARQKETER